MFRSRLFSVFRTFGSYCFSLRTLLMFHWSRIWAKKALTAWSRNHLIWVRGKSQPLTAILNAVIRFGRHTFDVFCLWNLGKVSLTCVELPWKKVHREKAEQLSILWWRHIISIHANCPDTLLSFLQISVNAKWVFFFAIFSAVWYR